MAGSKWLVANDLSFAYEGKVILQNLNFTVEEGAFFGIIGANGSGKSTLLKGLVGLKKPLKGSLEISSEAKKFGFGYLAQKTPFHKYFPASVMEIVLSGLLHSKGAMPFFNKSDRSMAREKMDLLGILHLQKRRFGELSGGEHQKCLLARALCAGEKILVLDEPLSALDENFETELCRTIKEVHKKGTTIIMVSHNVDYIKTNATDILEL